MITISSEDKGNYYIKTQQEIDIVKKQLQKLKPNSQSSQLLQNQYNQLHDQLQNLEEKLQTVNQAFYEQLINNFDNTVQKLPTLKEKNQQNYQYNQSISNNQGLQLPFIDQILNVRTLPQISVEPLGKSTLKPKGLHSVKSAIILNRNNQNNKSKKQSEIEEKSLYQKGIQELLNQCQIKQQEVNSFLNPNNSVFKNQKANFFAYNEQSGIKTIQLESQQSQNLFKTDLQDQIQQIKQKESNITKFNMNNSKQSKQLLEKKKSNNLMESSIKFKNKELRESQQKNNKERPISQQNVTQTEFLIFIQNGFLQQDQLSYVQFMNKYYEYWNKIEPILISLQKIAQSTIIQECRIIGSKVITLAKQFDRNQVFSMAELLQCFDNWEELQQILRVPTLLYKQKNGYNLAIIKIQAAIRGYLSRKNYLRIKVMIEKVIIIQRFMRVCLFRRKVQKQIIKNNTYMLERFKNRQNVFKEEWPYIKIQQRFEIHINSYSYEEIKRLSMEKFPQRENASINRIFNLKNPLIHIIYISPYDLPLELIDYFYKILTLGEIEDCKSRLHFVWPENYSEFNNHMSLSQLLYYSPKALKRIKSLINGFSAYIIPGTCTNDDIKLSDIFNVPLLCGLPQLHQYYSSKSGSQVLFEELQLPQPPIMRNIYDEKELINSLAVLIIKNQKINTWVIKIDDETCGRGIAWIEVHKIMKKINPLEINQLAINLTQKIKKKLHFAYPYLYSNYNEFIMNVCNRGAIIEGSPVNRISQIHSISFNFKIDPDGEIQTLGSYEKIKANEVQPVASFSPQQYLNINQDMLCNQIAQKLFSKGLIGYFTIDTLGYEKENKQNFQVIGLDCFLNQYSSAFIYFDFLMKGQMDIQNRSYNVEDINKQIQGKYSIYCPTIINEGLDVLQYKTFFQLCRLESISFNLEKKIGSTFILIDSLQSGVISAMTVGNNPPQVVKYMLDVIQFVQKNVGRGTEQNQINNRSDKINMMSIHQRFKTMLKKLEGNNYTNSNTYQL